MNNPESQNFFKVTTPETAYILGFLWADGSVFESKNKYYTRLFINELDAGNIQHHFEKFNFYKKWVAHRYECQSKTRNNRPKIQFSLHSTRLSKFLVDTLDYKYKSINSPIKVINFIPKEFHNYFWLGYFDGDGCFYFNQKEKRITIAGAYEQKWDLILNLFASLNIKGAKIFKRQNKRGSYSYLYLSNIDGIKKFGDYIYQNYKNNSIGLKRKHDKFEKILESFSKPLSKSSKFQGVTFNKRCKKWRANICYKGQKFYLGSFNSEIEAYNARINKALDLQNQLS